MRSISLLVTALALVVLWGCDPNQTKDINGQQLPLGFKVPPGYVAYITSEGDTTFNLARRFYGAGWKYYLIENANKVTIKNATRSGGGLKKDAVLLIPPDLTGRPPIVTENEHTTLK